MTAANKKFEQLKRKIHSVKSMNYQRNITKETESPTINTEDQTCQHCDFKAHYKFIRCPECGKEQK